MSDTQIPRFRLDSPADMAQLVPYLVGFTPEESLVIVVIDDHQVQVTARADLAEMQQRGAAEDVLDRIWARFPTADATLIAYTQHPETGWALLERSADHLPDAVLRQTMLVNQDTWRLPDGTHGRLNPSSRITAEAAHHGLRTFTHRADLEARFASAPDSPELAKAVRAALDDLPRHRDLPALLNHTRDLLHSNLNTRTPFGSGRPATPISTTDAAQLAHLVKNRHARDFALASITKATAPRHLALWSEVLNHTPSSFAAVPAVIAGIAAWVAGDGASANIALTRAQAATTRLRASGPAELLEAVIDQVLPPSAWPSVRGRILEHAGQAVHHALITHIRGAQTTTPAANVFAPEAGRSRPTTTHTGPTL